MFDLRDCCGSRRNLRFTLGSGALQRFSNSSRRSMHSPAAKTHSGSTHFKKVFPHPLFTLKYRMPFALAAERIHGEAAQTQPSRSAQVTNDAGKIDAAVAAFHEALVDRGGARAERRGGVRRARGGLRQLQVLQ